MCAMSATNEEPREPRAAGSDGDAPRRGLPRWKKVLLATAVFLVVAGLGLRAIGWGRSSSGDDGPQVAARRNVAGEPGVDPGTDPLVGNSFAPWESSAERRDGIVEGEPELSIRGRPPQTPDDFSPVLFKGGLTFLVGFAVGYALRIFARLSLLFVGIFMLAMFGLSYAGAITIHWDILQTSFDHALASLKQSTAGFQEFIAGSVPLVGMGGIGLFTGFKKN